MNKPRIAFFGTDPLALPILTELEKSNLSPCLIISGQDTLDRKGRALFPTEKQWALEHSIPVLQPKKIDAAFIETLASDSWDLFIVASYGKILPASLLHIPKHGVLNVHPSLLPLLRGPSPIRSAILNNMQETGVTIMLMDDKMDHGPIISQKKIRLEPWPLLGRKADRTLAEEGARLLATVVPLWLSGEIHAHEQHHELATFCSFIRKEDAELDFTRAPEDNLRRICAYDGWPTAFFYAERSGKKIRVQVLEAHIEAGALVLDTVKPEGKQEMSYPEFVRGNG